MSASHKTIFIIDHSPSMSRRVQVPINLSTCIGNRKQTPADVPKIQVPQSLWSSSVESISEYCRIVWDIFSLERSILFLVGDPSTRVPRFLNTWEQQGMEKFMAQFSGIGAAAPGTGELTSSMQIKCLEMAINKLTEQRERDKQHRQTVTRGRIVFVGSMQNDQWESSTNSLTSNSQKWRKEITNLIKMANEKADRSSSHLPIGDIEILFLNLKDTKVINPETRILADERHFKLEMCHVEAGKTAEGDYQLGNKMMDLVQHHHKLMKTTITGIPMKEEQGEADSSNYDVPILHPQLGNSTEKLTLKYESPKADKEILKSCSAAVKVSPQDVNSRQSDCLTKFITVNKRTVQLKDRDNLDGTKVHMLTSHGGDIYLHRITEPLKMTEPPSMLDGPGGKRSDYRTREFYNLLMHFTLAPTSNRDNTDQSLKSIERATRVWPMVNSDSALYAICSASTKNDALLNFLIKREITDEEKNKCISTLSNLIDMERQGGPIPWSTGGRGGKTPRKADQYKKLWQELDQFLEAHQHNSPKHRYIYDMFLDFFGKSTATNNNKRAGEKETKMETNVKQAKTEKTMTLFDLVKTHDDEIKPRKFYAQLPGLTKVELYPKMGGETDQVDGTRKDGSDALENKQHLDAQNTKLRNEQLKHGKSLDPRLRGMAPPIGANPSMDPRLRNQPMQQQQQQPVGAMPPLGQIDPRRPQQKGGHVIDPRFDPRNRNQRK